MYNTNKLICYELFDFLVFIASKLVIIVQNCNQSILLEFLDSAKKLEKDTEIQAWCKELPTTAKFNVGCLLSVISQSIFLS